MIKPSVGDLLKSSFRSILKNKGRTILTSLGIIIGVTSVILLTSIGNGLKSYVTDQFDALGANSVFVTPGKVFNDNGGFNSNESGRYVTAKFGFVDVNNLKRSLKGSQVIPMSVSSIEIKSSKVTKTSISLVGTNHQYASAANVNPSNGNGRSFTKEEVDKKSEVVVLGYGIARDLFPNSSPIGKRVIIKGKNFRVIGVVDKKGGSMGGPDQDNQIYTPIANVFDINGNEDIHEIFVKTKSKEDIPQVKEDIKNILLKKFDKDAFTVFDSSQLLSSINSIIGILTIGLSGIAAISLVVGGIGIMNIMLVTVSERTREIGLRKAIGAYPRAILVQFLIEAIILSSFGGLIGVLLGGIGTLIINNFFPAKITVDSVAIAFGVSAIVGIIFGVAPARKASQLSPIEALRYE